MKKQIAFIILTLIALTSVVACGKSGQSDKPDVAQPDTESAKSVEGPAVDYVAKDDKVSIAVPESWSVFESTDSDVILSVEDKVSGVCAVMYSDEKADYTAAKYLEEHLVELKDSESGVEYTAPAVLEVNGINAAYSEYKEKTSEGTDKYIIATYEVGENIYELLISVNEDGFDANKAAMMTLAKSFKTLNLDESY